MEGSRKHYSLTLNAMPPSPKASILRFYCFYHATRQKQLYFTVVRGIYGILLYDILHSSADRNLSPHRHETLLLQQELVRLIFRASLPSNLANIFLADHHCHHHHHHHHHQHQHQHQHHHITKPSIIIVVVIVVLFLLLLLCPCCSCFCSFCLLFLLQ